MNNTFIIRYNFYKGEDEEENEDLRIHNYQIVKTNNIKKACTIINENDKCPYCFSFECILIKEAFIISDRYNSFITGYICKCKTHNRYFFLKTEENRMDTKCTLCGTNVIGYKCNIEIDKLYYSSYCKKCGWDIHISVAPSLLKSESRDVLIKKYTKYMKKKFYDHITDPYMLTYDYYKDFKEMNMLDRRYRRRKEKQVFETNKNSNALIYIDEKGKLYDINNKAKYKRGLTRRCPFCGSSKCNSNVINNSTEEDIFYKLNKNEGGMDISILNVCKCIRPDTSNIFIIGSNWRYVVNNSNTITCSNCGSMQEEEILIKRYPLSYPTITILCKQCNKKFNICFSNEQECRDQSYILKCIEYQLIRLKKAGYKFKVFGDDIEFKNMVENIK